MPATIAPQALVTKKLKVSCHGLVLLVTLNILLYLGHPRACRSYRGRRVVLLGRQFAVKLSTCALFLF